MDDKIIRQHVIDALDWDPSVDSAAIGVAVNTGVAVLTGHVSDYAQKLTAVRIARGVKGVSAIADEIEVRFANAIAPTDEDIAGRAANLLKWDVAVPSGAVQVKVSKGWIYLTGQVDWNYQRGAAESDMRRLVGVKGVTNAIDLTPRATPEDVTRRIHDAMEREANIDAGRVTVSVAGGKARLDGKVHSWFERDVIERAAWSAPGVHAVEDHVQVG